MVTPPHSVQQKSARLTVQEAWCEQAVTEAIADCILPTKSKEAEYLFEDNISKSEVEQLVRKAVNKKLDDAVIDAVKKQMGTNDVEQIIVKITGKALAKFFELMFTRRGTWQSQLKL